jgi:hypothetical protein
VSANLKALSDELERLRSDARDHPELLKASIITIALSIFYDLEGAHKTYSFYLPELFNRRAIQVTFRGARRRE